MSHQEKPMKISKQLRLKAHEFLSNPKNNNNILNEIIQHLNSGADVPSCLLALELIFTTLLKNREMFVEIVPLKLPEHTPENDFKLWLKNCYDECFKSVLDCLDSNNLKLQTQGLSTAMNFISQEGKFPLDMRNHPECFVPLNRLKPVLTKLLSCEKSNSHLINKFTEFLLYDDILFFTWKALPPITAKSNVGETYILNYLYLIEKLQLYPNQESKLFCAGENATFSFEETLTNRVLNKVWNCIMLWNHTPATHKQLLIVLLERVLPHLEKPLFLTDFLMDSLDVGGPISLLALQGIFTMIQVHNLDYPNIFTKLYSMFEPEIFITKYKARLFYLSDLFLSSTHLPENLVAAFAKRLARLALVAPSEDIIIICMFVGNLILRHPGLKCLLNYASTSNPRSDPFIMEESDPVKSNAINSSLWEIQGLQQHVLPTVAKAATFINASLPSVEWDLSKVLDNTGEDIFDKEIKKYSKLVALAFEKPNGIGLSRGEKMLQFWNV